MRSAIQKSRKAHNAKSIKEEMTTVTIKNGTKLHEAIKTTAEKFEINPNAFATGLLYAVLEKKVATTTKQN